MSARLTPGDRCRYVREGGRLGLRVEVLEAPIDEHGEQRLVRCRLPEALGAAGTWLPREKLVLEAAS